MHACVRAYEEEHEDEEADKISKHDSDDGCYQARVICVADLPACLCIWEEV